MNLKERLSDMLRDFKTRDFVMEHEVDILMQIIEHERSLAHTEGYDEGYAKGDAEGYKKGLDEAYRNAEGFADHYLHLTFAEKQRMKKAIHTGAPY